MFAEAGQVKNAGESSVCYNSRPSVEDCEQRIDRFNPEARLIYLMRDQVGRALSHFGLEGREDRDLLTALDRKPEYIARSN